MQYFRPWALALSIALCFAARIHDDVGVLKEADFGVITVVEGTSSTHTVKQKNTRRYLDAWETNNDYGATTRNWQGNDSQEWIFTCVNSRRREYHIQHKVNRRYLDAYESGHDYAVTTRNWQGNDSQIWIVTRTRGGYTIQQKTNRRYLDAYESGHDYGARTRPDQHNDSQIWILDPLLAADSRGAPLTVTGAWEAVGMITSGGSSRSVTVGTTTTEEDSSAFSAEVTASVSAGFSCMGAEVSASLSSTVGTEMARSSSFSTSRSQTVTQAFTATTRGRFLWQWVFRYQRQGREAGATMMESFAQTVGRWEPPACLPGYARDQNDGAQQCATQASRIR